MKIYIYNSFKLCAVLVALVVMGCSEMSTSDNASQADILIFPLADCKSEIVYSGDNNCDKNQCEGKNNCICATKNEVVTWFIAGKNEFKLHFPNGSTFEKTCGDKFANNKHKCKVKNSNFNNDESFDYGVVLNGCSVGTDPRIVIRKTN